MTASIVAIAKPAPLTMHPMSPPSLTKEIPDWRASSSVGSSASRSRSDSETGMTEQRVVVDGHLGVEREPVAIPGQDQWVDLGERRIFFQICVVQLPGDRGEPGHPVGGEAEREADLPRLPGVQTEERVDQGAHDPLWPVASDLLDVDAALRARHDDVLTAGAIEGDPEIELLGDVDGGRDQHLAHRVPANVETEDRRGGVAGFFRGAGELDAARLAATSGEHLGFHDDRAARRLGKRHRLVRRWRQRCQRFVRMPWLAKISAAWYSCKFTIDPRASERPRPC